MLKKIYGDFSGVNGAIEALHGGTCLRAVVNISKNDLQHEKLPTLVESKKFESGYMNKFSHWSEVSYL